MKTKTTVTHTNGGLEQGLLEVAKEEKVISENDLRRLNHLQSLPQNRTEVKEVDLKNTGKF